MEKGYPYDLEDTRKIKNNKSSKVKKSAHFLSSELEYHCRHHPKEIEKALKKEIA